MLSTLLEKKSILVADDEAPVRQLLRGVLEEAGHEVHEACHGDDVLRIVAQEDVDLVILDVVMPEREGFETCLALRRTRPSLPIIAISGVDQAPLYLRSMSKLGAVTLQKPFSPSQLLRLLAETLAR